MRVFRQKTRYYVDRSNELMREHWQHEENMALKQVI